MSKPPPRGVFKAIWDNFAKSLIPRKTSGNLMGQDQFGTKYFEIPAEPERGKRKPSRWFQAIEKEKFDQEIPVEWEAWLRGRRKEPPTQTEISRNIAIQQTAVRKAKELEEKEAANRPVPVQEPAEPAKKSFPTYSDYEQTPGKDPGEK